MSAVRAIPLIFTWLVAFGCGGSASAPDDSLIRHNPTSSAVLTDVSIGWDGLLWRHDVAAGIGTGYVLIQVDGAFSDFGARLFIVGATDVATESLSFWAGWARTDGTGKLYLVGGSSPQGFDVFGRDGAAWRLDDEVMPREFVGVDAALTKEGALS